MNNKSTFSKVITLLFPVIALVFVSLPAQAKKVALVIGNGEYSAATALPNPANDARLMTATLRQAGFEVLSGIDADKATMNSLLDSFTEKAYEAEVAMIYYAGHGMQVDGKNYLIPTDAELSTAAHLKTRTIEMNRLIEALPADPAVGVLIIDACRDNPLARSYASALPATRSASVNSGLAAIQTTSAGDGTGGLLIGFATEPGAVALDGTEPNSPYTAALAKHLVTPGESIHSALTKVRNEVSTVTKGKQRPWYNASLGRELFLGGAAKPQPALAISPVQNVQPGIVAQPANEITEAEQSFWDQVVKFGTIDSYKLYLTQYPNGHFKTLAEFSIANLQSGTAGNQTQTQVAALGTNGTAVASDPVASTVGNTVQTAAAATGQAGNAPAALDPGPTAILVPEALKGERGTRETQRALNLTRKERIDLQLRLRSMGHDPKGVDGGIGPNSRKAISGWQGSNEIPQTGYLTFGQYDLVLQQSAQSIVSERAAYEASLNAKSSESASRHYSPGKSKASGNKKSGTKKASGKKKRKKVASKKRSKSKKRLSKKKKRRIKDFAAGVVTGVIVCKIAC